MLVVLLQASARDPQLAARLRPVIWMLLLAHLLAGAPAPRRARAAGARGRVGPRCRGGACRRTRAVAGRRPRG